MKKTLIHNCRVCGFYMSNPPWGEDNLTPNYEICPCCGVEFGNEDYTKESTKDYRQKWLEGKAKWFEIKEKPLNWDLEKQMESIPKDWKDIPANES